MEEERGEAAKVTRSVSEGGGLQEALNSSFWEASALADASGYLSERRLKQTRRKTSPSVITIYAAPPSSGVLASLALALTGATGFLTAGGSVGFTSFPA